MIYPDNFEEKIGFNEIRTMLKGRCLSELGVECINKMEVLYEGDEIRERLEQVKEMRQILNEEDDFPVENFIDIRQSLMRIRLEGTHLEELEVFDLKRSLSTISDIVNFLKRGSSDEEDSSPYPALLRLVDGVVLFPEIVKRADAILNKYGRIKDNASPELARIRSEIESAKRGISHSLRTIISTAQRDGLIDKDVTPTIRDGRLVIPVAPSLKRKFRGIIHDESATGKTVFIEPTEVVESNNRIRELQSAEQREIIRILKELTDWIRPQIGSIIPSYHFMGEIDFVRAKALVAESMQAAQPPVSDNPVIDWVQAVHPILSASLKRRGGKVVPLDIEITSSRRILIISGPNAGGKSVCLKTVGLLQYMLQCGLPIPVRENSKTGVFDSVFIDIGDEQSITNELSTYSSHLLNMKMMMKHASPRSLLLIDEFGGGTEPQIGGALAEAILKRFIASGTYGIITTHYQNLKRYADGHSGVVNGAMLYDREKMQALFQLQIGQPGSSFAVEIENTIRSIREIQAEREKTREVRRELEDFKKEVADVNADSQEDVIQRKMEQIQRRKQRREERRRRTDSKQGESQPRNTETVKISGTPRPGDYVRIKGQTSIGLLKEISGKKAVVVFGTMQVVVDAKRLVLDSAPEKKVLQDAAYLSRSTRKAVDERKNNFKPDIDVRGMRGDEALRTVMSFVDDAQLLGVARIRILHGTGTGALREVIRQYLRTVPGNVSFHDEHVQFGGSGITVVDFQ